MLWTVVVILFVLWLLGIVTSYTAGGLIHILLVLALVVIVIRLLPVMFTVSMAVGAKELAKRGVLVTRLSAAEDAATMDVLCVDKTGTITMNQLAVTGVIPLEHATEADVSLAGALASQEAIQDPTDLSFCAVKLACSFLAKISNGQIAENSGIHV